MSQQLFQPNCRRCARLWTHLKHIRQSYPDYHAKPVPAFGKLSSQLHIVGLAPGLHGANATGRPFTGDYAGILLYETLHKFGFANQPDAYALDDGLKLRNCRITNAVKCLPPQNKPNLEEIKTCNVYLKHELAHVPNKGVILALGAVAHHAVLRAFELKPAHYPFGHHRVYELDQPLYLVDSYHCSRYNTQTKRLTRCQFEKVFKTIVSLLKK